MTEKERRARLYLIMSSDPRPVNRPWVFRRDENWPVAYHVFYPKEEDVQS